ncbi:hypothetical protein [Nocardia cyriacigeorgica]|uniref:hypothetical protein n=1 Tax=Nocardia cyriacigeorgica TaxID=135487 RepID=UPI0024563C43|nr:hypothetical protein [Nocardia cyriacigeorgica]
MGISTYRDDVRAGIYAPHVRELNEYVDTLRAKKPGESVPHISPEFGGSQARLLLLTLSPGEKTRLEASGGSGLLSVENSDPGAARIAEALDHAGIDRMDCVGWNVYPWYVKGFGELKPQERDPYLHEGVDLLIQVIARLPRLRAVFVFGKAPDLAWAMFRQSYPKTTRSLKYFHHRSTGPTGYIGSVAQRMEWRQQLFDTMDKAAAAIGQ